ncbi:hypothetical protein QUF90_06380 [Desulfococcaceae bacterium HSG9]|nr:hypothetical protein [Desulfococcaceae bacterium HSG9]
MNKAIIKKAGKIKPSPTMIIDGLKAVVEAHKSLKVTAEEEKTKRSQIKADKEVFIKKIHAQKEVMLFALDKSFKERHLNFENMFEKLDQAINSDKVELASHILGSIVDLAKDTPFRDIQRTISDFHNENVNMIEI